MEWEARFSTGMKRDENKVQASKKQRPLQFVPVTNVQHSLLEPLEYFGDLSKNMGIIV